MEYQTMTYSVNIMGKAFILPPRTIDVDAKIEEMSRLDGDYRNGNLTRLEVLTKMHTFVESLAPGSLPPLEKIDTNELTAACVDIIQVYDAALRKARIRARADGVQEIIQKAIRQPTRTIYQKP